MSPRPLFDSYGDTSSDDESFLEEDDTEKKKLDLPLFDKDSISNDMNPIYDEELEDIECMNSLTNSSPKIDSLLEEFGGELALIDPIPPGIDDSDFDPEEEIRLIEKLLYENSSPRPPEEFNSEISDATIESSSPSPIPVEDSDSFIKEIDLFLDPDDSIPPGTENDDYDSEGDILFLEESLSNDSLPLPENESFHFDSDYVPSSLRPPAKPPDDGIFFDSKPDTGVLSAKGVDDISELYVLMPSILPTYPTLSLSPVIDTLLPFSSENDDKIFNPDILSSHLLSHRDFNPSKIIYDFSESPMIISGRDIPILDVLYLHFYPP
ncbi:hypothetical protein Tco_1023677 [Tanacetum coccineum]